MLKTLIFSAVLLIASTTAVYAGTNVFSQDLRLGSTGPEVTALQDWLIANGYDIPLVSSGAVDKGYYGFQTMAAVINYQKKVGLPAYGFFGPMTRGLLNSTHSNYPSTKSSSLLQVVTPNGGDVWTIGTTQNIAWTASTTLTNIATTSLLTIKLDHIYVCSTRVCPMIAYAPYTIATNIPLNQDLYAWKVGFINNSSGQADITPAGKYSIQICETSTNDCDSSDYTFSIVESPPTCPTGYTCTKIVQ
jgi:peptidoglycan hydrolase-like protein with peptidoglycan-binding domain